MIEKPEAHKASGFVAYSTTPIMREYYKGVVMFGRKIQVGLVKEKTQEVETTSEEFSKKMNVTASHLKEIARSVVVGVGVYVILDTVRQVMVETAKHPKV